MGATLHDVLPREGTRIRAAAAAILYAAETLRFRLEGQLTPDLSAIVTLLEERAAEILQNVPVVLRSAEYLDRRCDGPVPPPDGTLADAVRRELDNLPLALARGIHAKGWKLGRRPVPLRVARDAIRPVLDAALATGRGRVLLEFHDGAAKGPWLSVSWCRRASGNSRGMRPPLAVEAGQCPPIPSLAALAAQRLGCSWRLVATPPRRVRVELSPNPTGRRARPQAASRVLAKASRPTAVNKALANSSSVPKR